MAEIQKPVDPRRPIVEVMARLGRETQLHLDERERHFKITDAVIIGISVVLIILAVFNVYYVRVLYKDLDGIVGNMESMLSSLNRVDEDMAIVADRIDAFDSHIAHMAPITSHVVSITTQLPRMHANMRSMAGNMALVEQDMAQLNQAIHSINPSMVRMTHNMGVMRYNVRQIARPMGAMNPILP
jgi:hypothetical protein